MNYISIEDMVKDIRGSISNLSKHDFDLVVGIPRSGMIPAYTIGLYLNLDVTDINSFIANVPAKRGITRLSNEKIIRPHDARKILLVDDSHSSGKSMIQAFESIPESLRNNVMRMVVYASSTKCEGVDFYIKVVDHPRLFEWNILNHSIVTNSCFDIDGVLCVDPDEIQNDDGERYIDFLENADPKFIPKYKIKYLVTNRLEKYREHTVSWLKKHNVQYQELIMLQMDSKEERQLAGVHSTHKAEFYKQSGCDLFVESDVRQAAEIMKATGKYVYCIDDNNMYYPNALQYVSKRPLNFFNDVFLFIPRAIYRKLPLKTKMYIRKKLKR